MRNWTDHGRRGRRDRLRSRFSRERRTGTGGRDLIRFRRNRELLARELTVMVLWLVVGFMLVQLARTLWTVTQVHLAERGPLLRLGLPLLPVLGSAGCLWRARRNWLEFLDIRREQEALKAKLQDLSRDPG